MRNLRLCVMLFALASILAANAQAGEPVVLGMREALKKSLATEPYYVSSEEACAMAQAALAADDRAGGRNVPDSRLWDRDGPSDIECPGLTAVDISHPSRRVHLPRHNKDGRIFIDVDDFCLSTCNEGKTYEMTRRGDAWIAKDSGLSWNQ